MSWDVLIFNFHGPFPSKEELNAKDFRPPPVGEVDLVRKKLSKSISEIDWSDPSWGILRGDGFRMEFNLQKDGIVQSFMIHIYGGGNPLPIIHKLCVDNDWFAFDTSSGWLDREDPSDKGWQAFQEYRDELKNTFINNNQE